MSKDQFLEFKFPSKCGGRTKSGEIALKKPIEIFISVHQHYGDDTNIHIDPECPYNCGAHGEVCAAAEKESVGVRCMYSCDIPYVFNNGDE